MRIDTLGRAFFPVLVILYSSYMIWEQFAREQQASTRNYALFMGGIAIVLAVAALVGDLLKQHRPAHAEAEEAPAAAPVPLANVVQVSIILASAIVLIALLSTVGYIVGLLIFTAVTAWALQVHSPITLVLLTVITVAVVHVVFVTWLQLPLPQGLLRGIL